jgi:hypothetical protein
MELLKSAYIIIYSEKKYLLEFDSNFIATIKNTYGADSVEKKQVMKIKTNLDSISVKYIPIKSIINTEISQIDVTQSSYTLR